ncbi:PAS domain S-box protein [Oleiharenicola lentus]|jgi:PAS domain S-box-containing protein|uniref:histidine kinase n=1 Tax=Oleiharenicola lentus TaxID=2508720 RepID=A0A4Q1C3R9_9BACT|nr:PAS domain S-box protein [Oleiharenicola lentus]RXK52992.1 PAS domain S-box protein [Oleiharenicola lentus]
MNQPADPSRTHSQPGVTGQHRRDEALILALDATLTCIWDYDLTTGQVTLDANWSRMRGGPANSTVTGIKDLIAKLHPEDRHRAWRATLNCVTGRAPEYSQEYRVLDQQGQWMWVHSRGRATNRDAGGRATRMIGTNIDITQRKTTELAASRQVQFLNALNQTTVALLQRRAKAEILEALAGRAAQLLIVTQVEVALIEGDELVTQAYGGDVRTKGGARAGRREAMLSWRAIDSHESVIVEDYGSVAEGSAIYRAAGFQAVAIYPILHGTRCLGVLACMRDQAGHTFNEEEREKGRLLAQLAALVIHNADIYEDSLRVAENRMRDVRESEARFRTVFNESPIPIILMSAAGGEIREVNKAASVTFGYAREEVLGRTTMELGIWADPQERPRIVERLQKEGSVHGHHTQMRAKDGRPLQVIYNANVVSLGGDPYLLSFVIDISAQKEAESALRQSEAKLRQAQKLESLGTLAGGIAHDFNNILTGILGFAHLCQADLAPDHPAAHWVDGILKSGERAKGLVQQILTFSRKTESMRGPVRLQLVTQESVALLRSTLPAMVRLECEIDPACPPVLADPTEIHQVILNLCTNAWHALPETGGCIEVRLLSCDVDTRFAQEHGPLQPGPHVRLSVRDNGKGMSAATIERIFEPFFTTKEAGKGTGLGLAVVHSIVQSHEGAIHLQSTPGQGTTFDLYFPALPTPTSPEESATTPAELPRGQGQSVLVVDDEPMSGTVISRLAEKFGYRVTYCSDPLQAIALFYANDFDLLVTDLAMPGLPGDELARQVIARKPGMPVLLLSGFIEPAKLDQLRQIGVREILNKPPSAEDLISAMDRCLQP